MQALQERETAKRFATVAWEIFAPLYPVMAERILRECGLTAVLSMDIRY